MLKRTIWGVHPAEQKANTSKRPIEVPILPDKVIIPVRQHIGAPCTPIVNKGDEVKKGQVIATSDAFVSTNIHASISGKVADIADYPHPVFGVCQSIVIENDGLDQWVEGIPFNRDWKKLGIEELRNIIRESGVVGMGGATFPTHVKLSPPKEKPVDTFILNAAECEPFLTSDHRMMLEFTQRIVEGVQIAMKVLGVERGFVGIEDNKPDAISAMEKSFVGTNVKVVVVPTRYPQGAEKMLIKMLTGREVPSGKLPTDIGVSVINVGTSIAIRNAVVSGIPLIERVVTVSGSAVKEPRNLLLRIGTTFQQAINYCGGIAAQPEKIIMGGPMMGIAESTVDVPVIKGTSGILALTHDDVNHGYERACIRCGRCIDACPMGLNPSMLGRLGERRFYQEALEDYRLLDCVECGSCFYICPAKRNIVQYIRHSKKLVSIDSQKKKGAV